MRSVNALLRGARTMRCVAATNAGPRCKRDGDVRVAEGRVCRQHWTWGYLVFHLPADVAVDPRVAERAAAVLGAA